MTIDAINVFQIDGKNMEQAQNPIPITYFNSYEEREESFRQRVGALIPRKYAGPSVFWDDFGEIRHRDPAQLTEINIAYVSSNPRDCLAFASPWQVLCAAAMATVGPGEKARAAVESVANQFGLTANLYQPIRTLSGGETVKVALAKCYLAAAATHGLVVASPYSWLSQKNARYLENTVQHYCRQGLPVELMALEGEDTSTPFELELFNHMAVTSSVPFELVFSDVRIGLGAPVSAFDSQPVTARLENCRLSLQSPCLVIGENGQGKSLVAKALSGAVSHEGSIGITAGGDIEAARLIFQDVLVQTLLRPFERLAALAPGAMRNRVLELYRELNALMLDWAPDTGCTSSGQPNRNETRTLLEIKNMLAAARLTGTPGMLILDEPDWGLTRTDSMVWVLAIVNVAHRLGIPVVIISHKPWWGPLAKSAIDVKKRVMEPREGDTDVFRMRLEPVEIK
jgi:energy-coupling factor transporter ATP-binding protein EcfA2